MGLEMHTGQLYLALLGLVVLERAVELVLTRRNARSLLSRGGLRIQERCYPCMVLLHASLLVVSPLEVWLFQRPFYMPLAISMVLLLVATMSVRYWAVATLQDRWTTQVFVVPGESPVAVGPYRWVRHPNYLAVAVEVPAIALVHSAWWSAALFTACNLALLRERIRIEEKALLEYTEYREFRQRRGAFLPRGNHA